MVSMKDVVSASFRDEIENPENCVSEVMRWVMAFRVCWLSSTEKRVELRDFLNWGI
jgi:hypothetical protein